MANVTSQSVAQMLDKASERFAGVITKTEKAIFDSAVELIKRLDIDANGYIKNTTANLKLLSDIKSKLARFASNKEYLRGVKELAQAFDDIYKQQVAYYSSSFAQKTMGDKAKNKFAAMQRVAVANTIDGLTGAGLQTGVLDSLNKMLLKAVTSGAKYSDLVAEFRSQLISSGDSQSSLAKYAGTYATTAMTQYVGQNNKLFTDDLGTEWFEYVGSSIETTREFCNVLIEHHPYIHKSEIPDILKGEIVSQKTGEVIHVALNPKTGLPKGMIEDTTPENLQINVGGWNCRHQLVPIAKEAVPENIRKKFEKEKEMRDNPDSGYARFMRDYDAKLNRLAVMAHVTGNLPLAASVTNDLSLTFEEYVQRYNAAYNNIRNAFESLQIAYMTIVNEVKVIMAEAIAKHYDDVFNKASSLLASHQWHNVTSRVQYQRDMNELSNGYTELKAMLAAHTPAKPKGAPLTQEEIEKGCISPSKEQEDALSKIAQSLGIEVQHPMTREEANDHKENPLYVRGVSHTTNCQTCTMVHLARRMGLDVEAIDNVKGSVWDHFRKLGLTWDQRFLNLDGSKPQYEWSSSYANKNGIAKMTTTRAYEFIEQSTRADGIYEIYVAWKSGRSAHVFCVERTNGKLRYFDPQSGEEGASVKAYIERAKSREIGILRIDDKMINPKLKGLFLKK